MGDTGVTWDLLEMGTFFGPKILIAIFCGGVIGLERELKSKAAGIKTNILICLGATLYTSVSVLIANTLGESGFLGDPARVAAQIVSGIGFLGGGAIIQSRGTVQGLTTAATIWVVAAIGICIGIGRGDLAVAAAVTVVLVLTATNFFEDRLLGRRLTFGAEIIVNDPSGQVRGAINQALVSNELSLEDFGLVERAAGASSITLRYRGHRSDNKKFMLELWSIPGVREIRQI